MHAPRCVCAEITGKNKLVGTQHLKTLIKSKNVEVAKYNVKKSYKPISCFRNTLTTCKRMYTYKISRLVFNEPELGFQLGSRKRRDRIRAFLPFTPFNGSSFHTHLLLR